MSKKKNSKNELSSKQKELIADQLSEFFFKYFEKRMKDKQLGKFKTKAKQFV